MRKFFKEKHFFAVANLVKEGMDKGYAPTSIADSILNQLDSIVLEEIGAAFINIARKECGCEN